MFSLEYEFLFVDVRMNGKNSDGENWSKIALKNALKTTELPCRIQKISYLCKGNEKKDGKKCPFRPNQFFHCNFSESKNKPSKLSYIYF